MTQCKQCGMCCEVVALSKSFKEIKALASDGDKTSDCNFAARNFIPISEKQAHKINPHLKNSENRFYYRCKMYCELTKKCTIHDIKPRICSGFPWYNNEPREGALLSENCSFQKDIKKKNA